MVIIFFNMYIGNLNEVFIGELPVDVEPNPPTNFTTLFTDNFYFRDIHNVKHSLHTQDMRVFYNYTGLIVREPL